MRKLAFSILLLAAPLFAQTGSVQGHSYLGGTPAKVAGMSSTNYLQGIIPKATITVYLTGTQTPATIFSNPSGGTLANPFTSNVFNSIDPGGWIFWANCGQLYDVTMSGGVAPNTYPNPVTITAVSPAGCGSGSTPGVTAIVPGTNITCSPFVSGQCQGVVTVNAAGSSGGTIPALPIIFVPATQTSANQIFVGHPLSITETVPAGCTGSIAQTYPVDVGGTSPVAAGSVVWTFSVSTDNFHTNRTDLCTFTWSPSGSVAVTGGAGGTISPGDSIAFIGNACSPSCDSGLQNVGAVINGTTPGGGSGGGFTPGGDLAGSTTSQQVIGLHSVPFCTGFTPTPGQVIQYTNTSSPNPCYTAATVPGTGTVTDGSGTSTPNQIALSTSTPHQVQYGTGLPNGTTATTQAPADNSTKVATDAFVIANAVGSGTVSNCSTFFALAYYPSGGNTVNCDGLILTDGNGNITAKTYSANGGAGVASEFLVPYSGTPPVPPGATTASYAVNSAGQAVIADGSGPYSRPCTAANASSLSGCQPTGSGTNVQINGGSTLVTSSQTGVQPYTCPDSSGSGTVQSCTSAPSFTPQTNNCILYTTTTANSGTGLTINVNSLGAKSAAIPSSSGWTTTLTANQIPANTPLLACYTGTNWNVALTGVQSSGGGYPTPVTVTANNTSGQLPVTGCFNGTNSDYEIRVRNIVPAGNGTQLNLYFNTGSGYDTTASNYPNGNYYVGIIGGTAGNTPNATGFVLAGSLGNTTGYGFSGEIHVRNANSTTVVKSFDWHNELLTNSSSIGYDSVGGGWYIGGSLAAITGFELSISSGNLVSGSVTCQPLPQ